MKKMTTRMIVEGGVCIALFIVLNFITLFTMPMGGSVTLGCMVPLFLFAYRWGGKYGILVGAVAGVLDFIVGGVYALNPVSIILDYPAAFACLGIAGFFGRVEIFGGKKIGMAAGALLGVVARFICHVVSGVLFYYMYANGQNVWLYSILYNGTFLLPDFAIALVILIPLLYVKFPLTEKDG